MFDRSGWGSKLNKIVLKMDIWQPLVFCHTMGCKFEI